MVNKIYLIVHPLFEQFFPLAGDGAPYKTTPQTKVITKNELHTLGLLINSAKQEKDSIVLFVQTDAKTRKPYYANYKRFFKYAKKELGARLVALSPEFGYALNPAKVIQHGFSWEKHFPEVIDMLSKINFDKRLTLETTGQYKDACVARATARLETFLKAQGINEISTKIRRETRTDSEIRQHLRLASKGKLSAFSKWRRKTFRRK